MPRLALLLQCSCLFTVCAFTVGCAVGPDFTPPAPVQTKTYTEAPQPIKTVSIPPLGEGEQHFIKGQEIPKQWWRLFQNEPLNELIVRGIQNNPNLKAAQAALRQAQANYRTLFGNTMLPAVDLQNTAQRERFSSASFGAGNPASSTFDLYNTQVNVSYTLDVFGKNRRALEALCAQVNYQQYEWEATYLSLTSNIVTAAITEASLEEQIKATHLLIEIEETLLGIIRKQLSLGGATLGDVLTQENQLAQTKTTLPGLEKNLAQTRHTLSILIGILPSESCLPTFLLSSLVLPTELPISLPSHLVRNRPDIRAAEALLHQASAQIGVATANLLPQVTLTGYYGWESTKLSNLFSPRMSIWDIMAQVMQPLFHGGALWAQREAAIAAYEQACAQYQETVLQAFKNVADALRALEADAKALKAQNEAELAAKNLAALSQAQYKLGAQNYITLLNAKRQYQLAVINRLAAQAIQFTDTTALFQSLGGPWWHQDPDGEPAHG